MDPNDEIANPNGEPDAATLTANAGALAAVDAALAGEAVPTADVSIGSEPGDDDDTGAGDGKPEGEGEAAPAATGGEGEGKPDGEAAPAADAKPDGEGGDKPAAKPSDEFGELPKDVKAETRERFETMKRSYDAVVAERDQAVEQAQTWLRTVESTGASSEQFGTMLGYLSAVNSNDPAGLQRAYDMVMEEAASLAKLLGKPLPGVHDPLDDPANADLKREVEEQDLTHARALEIAAQRQAGKLASAAGERQQQSTALQSEIDTATNAIRAFGAQQKATDPHYAHRMAILQPLVGGVTSTLPPAQWASKLMELYAAIPVPQVAPKPRIADNVPDPVRPSGNPSGAGGTHKAPGSALEAVDMALASLGRG